MIVCLFGVFAAGPVAATSVRPPEFAELVQKADYVVRVTVKSVNSEIVAHGSGKKITSRVELDVLEVIAGEPPQPLVLTMLGGRVGEKAMIIEGVPQFVVGDEHILFVRGNGRQFYPLVAMMHGVYPIKRDAASGREYVTRSNAVPLQDPSEVVLPMTSGGAADLQRRLASPARALTPAQFAQQIRAAAKVETPKARVQ